MTNEMYDDLHHLAAAYCLDALDADERERFETHLAHCATCRTDVAEMTATAGALAEASAMAPPPGLKERVMAEVATTRQEAPSVPGRHAEVVDIASRRRWAPVWIGAAAAVVLIAVGAVLVVDRGGNDLDDHLAAPDLVLAELDGDAGAVRIAWSPARDRVAVLADGLAAPGPGRVYELWAIAGGAPVPAGLFSAEDGTIREVVDVADLDVEAWGITIEPAGGSPAPTGDILYFAEV